MTRRKHPPPQVDPDDYGFEVAGQGFSVTPHELLRLLGLDSLACALYMRCLKPFEGSRGAVRGASFHRFRKILTPVQSALGGPRLPEPTLAQLERCIERLKQAGLITSYALANRGRKSLQIRLKKAPKK